VASRTERAVVNAAGLVQGIVLVTFPAASTIVTEPAEDGLSSGQYGNMFLPQVVTAIAGSLLGSALARRISPKRVYLLGLTLSLVSMGLLLASVPVKTDRPPPTRCCWSPRLPSGLPILSAALLLALLVISLRLPLRAEAPESTTSRRPGRRTPARFWCYAAFAVLYGICETMNGTGPSWR
jgi:MFS family permease